MDDGKSQEFTRIVACIELIMTSIVNAVNTRDLGPDGAFFRCCSNDHWCLKLVPGQHFNLQQSLDVLKAHCEEYPDYQIRTIELDIHVAGDKKSAMAFHTYEVLGIIRGLVARNLGVAEFSVEETGRWVCGGYFPVGGMYGAPEYW